MVPTKSVTKTICDCLRAGKPLKVCASVAGVSANRVSSWMRLGSQDSPEAVYESFHNEVVMAQGSGQSVMLDRLISHADTDWRAAREVIKLSDPELGVEEGKKVTVQHNHEVSGHVVNELISGDVVRDVLGLLAGFKSASERQLERAVIDVEVVEDVEDVV